jgi:PhzF family phenazine biosynthesis protein
MRTFRQVDVFGSGPLTGNPVAVVHDAEDLDDAQLQLFAQWTNLSETTYLLPPTQPDADYRLRIFTPSRELPFAGHPTLGSAHAWLEAGGTPQSDHLVQECAAGLITISRGDRLEFEAPPLVRDGPVDEHDLARFTDVLGISPGDVVDAKWVDNGPGWVALMLEDAQDVLRLAPDLARFEGMDIGVVAPRRDGGSDNNAEDPVTGSLNASLGQWLAGTVLPEQYVAAQGTAIGRRGRVHVRRVGETVWVGGDTRTTVRGEVSVGD